MEKSNKKIIWKNTILKISLIREGKGASKEFNSAYFYNIDMLVKFLN